MKKSAITFILCFFSVIVFSQDIIYTVSGEIVNNKTALDSILVENLTTGKSVLFGGLPILEYYQINLTKNAFWGTVGIASEKFQEFTEAQNQPGLLTVAYYGNTPTQAGVTVFNSNGQKILAMSKTIYPGNALQVRLTTQGVFFVRFDTPAESRTFKAVGALQSTNFDILVQEINTENPRYKSGILSEAKATNFLPGDTIRVSVYKNGYYARPKGMKIATSSAVNFLFDVSAVVVNGTGDGYVELNMNSTDITAFDTLSGNVQIKFTGEKPELLPGDLITVDLDTMGYLRKVVQTTINGNVVSAETEPAYMNEIFIDKEIKLNTGLMNPGVQLKSNASMEEISAALTDENGYIHPLEVYYHTNDGQVITKSAFTTPQNGNATVPLFDFSRDLRDDLYGKSGDNVHLYISEGSASLTANAVFEMDFYYKGELDADTKVRKGDLRYFTFYLDGNAGFLTKIVLDLKKAFEKEDTKKLQAIGKITAKFAVGPVPVWITFKADIYGNYQVAADASAHADFGFESTHNIKVGGTYTKASDSFTPIKTYSPLNKVYPLNLEGQVNANARLEIYPRTEIKFYGFFGPYAEIVPYVEGKYNARVQSQVTANGTENFLAWNSGIDLGLDFRVGSELTFLWGLFDKEFGPTVLSGPVWPLWKSPTEIKLITTLPEEAYGGTVIPLKLRVTDLLELPGILCPIYIAGAGTFSKQILFTNTNGEATVDWTVGSEGKNEFTATIYNANKTVIKKITHSVNVVLEKSKPTVITMVASDILANSSTLNGEVTSDGNATITQRGFYWSTTNQTPNATDNKEFVSGTTGTYNKTISNLQANTSYYYCAFATNSEGIATGDVVSFTTSGGEIVYGSFTDLRDGKTYKTVTLNGKEWMAENLAYLPAVSPSSSGSYTDPYYYVYDYQGTNVAAAKQNANYTTYGVLYNWPAAKAACLPGWHLPTDAEWTALENYLIANGYNYDGTTTENKIAKSLAATTNWNTSSETGAIGNNLSLNSKSGFSALPGGYRYHNSTFYYIGHYGYWWSSTEHSTGSAWDRYLYYGNSHVTRGNYDKELGFSVRCVRD